MQANRAARQTGQFDADRGTRLNGELKPLLLENVGEKLLGLRAAFHCLCLHPVQVLGRGRTAVREFGGSVVAGRSGANTDEFSCATVECLVKADLSTRVGNHTE